MPQIDTSDVSFHYEEAGSGTPVLLIHGHPFDCSMWAPQLKAGFPGFRLIALDLRNFGRTTSPNPPADYAGFAHDVVHFADALGLGKFVVAGLSMGGQIALEVAASYPQRIAGLAICDSFAQLDTPERKAGRYALADRLDAGGLNAYAVEVLPKMICPASIARKPQMAAEMVQMMRRAPAHGAAVALRLRAERRDYLPLLPWLAMPTLVVVGDQDAFSPVADAELMHRTIRTSTLVVIKDSGHCTNLEQPEAFNQALGNFLKSVVC